MRHTRTTVLLILLVMLSASSYGMYNTRTGRFLQRDPIGTDPAGTENNRFGPSKQYGDGMNLYKYVSDTPVNATDPSGLWGSSVHYNATFMWAKSVGYPARAARAVASADEGVDADYVVIGIPIGDTSPIPDGIPLLGGDQSYHFNRNLGGGIDSRLQHYYDHYREAKQYCRKSVDDPAAAAEQLGTAMHPYQDMIAHGDYGLQETGDIYTHHNSKSPQTDFGYPGHYPDDPTLDAVGGINGIPSGDAIKWRTITTTEYPMTFPGGGDPVTSSETYDYAIYAKGSQRINLTKARTKGSLAYYRTWVSVHGGCKCKKYFGIIP